MNRLKNAVLLAVLLPLCAHGGAGWCGDAPGDRVALSGLRNARAVVDLRVSDADKLLFNLELIRETFEGLAAQKVKPKLVVAIRGPGVKLLARDQAAGEIAPLIAELKAKGIRFEVCAVATRVFKVDPATLIPDVVLVGNALNSLIGYQNRGYALVVLN
jgi:intracellular sulfur oxidation DsrE/DsrF family protein